MLSTATLYQRLRTAKNIDEFLKILQNNKLKQSLPEHLNTLLLQKGIRKADVVRGSMLNRQYLYQIFSGEKAPSRDKLIAIAFGLRLTLDETQKMLKIAVKRELYPRDKRDALIMFTLQQEGDIWKVNHLLDSHNFETLGITSKNG